MSLTCYMYYIAFKISLSHRLVTPLHETQWVIHAKFTTTKMWMISTNKVVMDKQMYLCYWHKLLLTCGRRDSMSITFSLRSVAANWYKDVGVHRELSTFNSTFWFMKQNMKCFITKPDIKISNGYTSSKQIFTLHTSNFGH